MLATTQPWSGNDLEIIEMFSPKGFLFECEFHKCGQFLTECFYVRPVRRSKDATSHSQSIGAMLLRTGFVMSI